MIVCLAVVGHQNNPLYIQSFTESDDALKLHHIVHCSLDVVDERVNNPKKSSPTINEAFLGLLYPTENYKVYGYLTNTKVKFIMVTTDLDVRDADVRNVLPSVMDKDGIYLLTELQQHWRNYKMMANCLALIFHYLDRQIQDREIGIPRLVDISFRSFHELGPRQPDALQCGYYVMRSMREITENVKTFDQASLRSIFTQKEYTEEEIDEVRSEWADCVQDYI